MEEYFRTKAEVISGTDYKEVHHKARAIYLAFKKRTKRRTYIRSAYFKTDKVFLDLFWEHLQQKNWRDRVRRLKLYSVALDLIQHSKIHPVTVQNPNKGSEVLHRFRGETKNKNRFIVQIKENKRTNQKVFLSVFPE